MLAVNFLRSEELETSKQYLNETGYIYHVLLYKAGEVNPYLLISSTESQEEANNFAQSYVAGGWVLVGAEPPVAKAGMGWLAIPIILAVLWAFTRAKRKR